MTTNADRILANLPPTFAPLPRPTAISALADAFGGELLQAENTLAAVMFAHWVDYADANGDVLADLPRSRSYTGSRRGTTRRSSSSASTSSATSSPS